PAFGAPYTPFLLIAGATFGVAAGLLGSAIAVVINLTLCYFLVRGRLRTTIVRLFHRFHYQIPDLGGPGKRPARFALMVKLAPAVPTSIKNYALAIAGVPFPIYLGVSLAVTGLYVVSLVVLGKSLLDHDWAAWVVPIAVLIAVPLALWSRRRRRRRA